MTSNTKLGLKRFRKKVELGLLAQSSINLKETVTMKILDQLWFLYLSFVKSFRYNRTHWETPS